MKNNRKHRIVESLTLFDLFGSFASEVETGKEKPVSIQILVPNFVNGRHLDGYKIGKPILDTSGHETDNETGYEMGDEKLLKVSISSVKKSDDSKDLIFEGVSKGVSNNDDHDVRIYISRVNDKILKSLRFI